MQPNDNRWKHLFCSVFFLTCWPFFLPSLAEATPPSQKNQQELVQQLGADSFEARTTAFQKLKALEASAIPALKTGLTSNKPEIRQRCRQLLEWVQQTDVERQLKFFVETGNQGKLKPLPGWDTFSKKLGDNYRTRNLFVDIYLTEPNLFRNLDQNSKQVTNSLQNRCRQLHTSLSVRNSSVPPFVSYGQIGGILYISTFASGLDTNTFRYFYYLFNRQEVKGLVEGDPLLRELMSEMMMNQSANSQTFSYRLNLIQNYNLLPAARQKLLPEMEKQVNEILKNPALLSRLQSLASQVNQLGLNELADKKLKPFIIRQAKNLSEKGGDYRQLQYIVNSANILKMQQTMDQYLKPAFYKVIGQYRNDTSRYSQVYSLVSVARTLKEESALVDFLRPALREKMAKAYQNADETLLTRLYSDSLYMGLQKESSVFLKPAARKVILAYLEKGNDVNNFQKAINLANRFQMGELKEKTLKPFLERFLEDSQNVRLDINQLYQVFSLTRSLGVAGVEKKFKPLAIRTFQNLEKQKPSTTVLGRALSLGEQLQLKEAIPLLLKAAQEKSVHSYYRGRAVQFVGKFGNKEHIEQLLPFLKDASRVSGSRINNINLTTQIRDIALASMVHLSGQKLTDYGFDYARLTNRGFPNISYNCLGFSNDQKRREALKKWEEWSQNQNK